MTRRLFLMQPTFRLCLQTALLLTLAASALSAGVPEQRTSREQLAADQTTPARAKELNGKRSSTTPNILFAIADDWSAPHAGAYGDKVVKTPVFDRVAREGMLFTRAYCVSPSCTPSRAAVLTGQAIHRLDEGGNLWSTLPSRFPVFPDILEADGYYVGYTGKGWDPGVLRGSGRTRNPAGPRFNSFAEFYRNKPANKPFYFWYGSHDPHRPYAEGSGVQSGMRLESVVVPPYLPDTPEVRRDILDYYFEVEKFDQSVGEMLKMLEDAGELDNTLVVITSDNGWPFPRGKTNLYDAGTLMPLAVRWPRQVKGGAVSHDFISFMDFAPTFLEAAGLKQPGVMTGRSFLGLLRGERQGGREMVFVERERHADARAGNVGYPARAVRTKDYLYIRNIHSDRWPAGDPPNFNDIDNINTAKEVSPTKELLLKRKDDAAIAKYFHLATAKRPAEELYDLRLDPSQIVNVAEQGQYADVKKRLRAELDRWMRQTGDPRAFGNDDRWDRFPYHKQEETSKERGDQAPRN